MSAPAQRPESGLGDARNGLLVLAVAVFAAITTELLPVGLLPQISAAFGVSEAAAGLLVSAYAGMVAVLSVPLALATRRLPRKPVLLATIGGYLVSNAIAAVAPSFAVLAAGRVLGGVTHALFFSVCIGYAARLVPATLTGRALALASAGISGGLVLGVPLATALGDASGWRLAFGALAAVVGLVLVMAAVVLPPVDGSRGDDAPYRGRRRDLATVVAANGVTYLGTYVLYTFISVVLRDSGAPGGWVGPTLLLFGVCGLIGLRLAAPQLDLRPHASAVVIPALMAAGTGAVALAYPRLGLVVLAGMVWLTAFGPAASLYQAASVRDVVEHARDRRRVDQRQQQRGHRRRRGHRGSGDGRLGAHLGRVDLGCDRGALGCPRPGGPLGLPASGTGPRRVAVLVDVRRAVDSHAVEVEGGGPGRSRTWAGTASRSSPASSTWPARRGR